MKIAILTNFFPPTHVGGTEITTYYIAKELTKKNHEVHILTSSVDINSNEYHRNGFYIHKSSHKRMKIFSTIYFWIKIFFLLRKINPDVVHAQSFDIALPAFFAKKLLNKPYLIYSRNSPSRYPKITRVITCFPLKNANLVISLTLAMKKEIESMYNQKNILVIPNGIMIKSHQIKKKEYSSFKKEFIIVSVARLIPEKGLEYLICSMRLIVEKFDCKLIIIGEGSDEEYLKNKVSNFGLTDKIEFVGKVPNEEIYKYYNIADVFVLPSISEGFPVTILEAMSFGIPIITTNICGIPEIVKDNVNGFLVHPRSSIEIAEKVIELLDDFEIRKRISNNNLIDVKNYTIEKVVLKLDNLYKEISENK